MDPLLLSLTTLHGLSLALLIGGVASFVASERRISKDDWPALVALDKTLQARGALHGPLMALAIFTGLGLYYLKAGGFTWDPTSQWGNILMLKLCVFLPTWIHWGWQEVVMMDGVRKHWPEEGAAPSEAFKKGHRKVYISLSILLLELMIVFGVGAAAGLSSPL